MSAETRQNGADDTGDVDAERDDDDEDDEGEETTRLD